MCHEHCIDFGKATIQQSDIAGKSIIEIGARNVNGSLRSFAEAHQPTQYVGVDIVAGPGVDEVCAAEDLIKRFGLNKFDLLICTEVLEHVRDWKKVIRNIKNIVKPGGIVVITTRSEGFDYHGFPYDFWRYQNRDMEKIFSDFKIELLQEDPLMPGVFIKAKKPDCFTEINLANFKLYSAVKGRRSFVWTATAYWLATVVPLFQLFGQSKSFGKIMDYNAHPSKIPFLLVRKLKKLFGS